MALIIEDGSGKSTATSYVTTAEASAYHTARGNTLWASRNDLHEVLLTKASFEVDALYGDKFLGMRLLGEQAFAFPRYTFTSNEGQIIQQGTVPAKLKHAVCEVALILLENDSLFDVDNEHDVQSKSDKVGDLQVSVTYKNTGDLKQKYEKPTAILKPLLRSGTSVRLVL